MFPVNDLTHIVPVNISDVIVSSKSNINPPSSSSATGVVSFAKTINLLPGLPLFWITYFLFPVEMFIHSEPTIM